MRFVVGAYLEVLTWWLDQGATSSPEAMDALFQRLASHGLQAPARNVAG